MEVELYKQRIRQLEEQNQDLVKKVERYEKNSAMVESLLDDLNKAIQEARKAKEFSDKLVHDIVSAKKDYIQTVATLKHNLLKNSPEKKGWWFK